MFLDTERISRVYGQASLLADYLKTNLNLIKPPDFELVESEGGAKYYCFKANTANLEEKLAALNKKLFGASDLGFHPAVDCGTDSIPMIAIPVSLLPAASAGIRSVFDDTIRIDNILETNIATPTLPGEFRTEHKLDEILTKLGIKPAERNASWWKPENIMDVNSSELLAYTKQQTEVYCSPLLDIAPAVLERRLAKANLLLAGRGIQLSVAVAPDKDNQCYLAVDSSLIQSENCSENIDFIKDLLQPKMEILRAKKSEEPPAPAPKPRSWKDKIKEKTQKITSWFRNAA